MTRTPFIAPTDTLSLIPTAAQAKLSKPKNRRAWEKRNPLRSHRIPTALHPTAKEIRLALAGLAEQYMTTHANIAAALMHFSLSELRSGKLHLTAQPNPNGLKMKIVWSCVDEHWPQEIPLPKKKKPAPLMLNKAKGLYLGYRWGHEVDVQISAEAEARGVTCGETLVRLMQYALDAYRSGRLRLKEASVVVKQQVNATWS